MWDLYTQGALKGMDDYAGTMRSLILKDRSITRLPSLKSHFVEVIGRELRGDGLSCSATQEFSNWMYENSNRCPGIRLSYEVWHQIVKNKTDVLQDSDMEDYQHLINLPYVDVITLDRRMTGYVAQAAKRMGMDIKGRICKSVVDILDENKPCGRKTVV